MLKNVKSHRFHIFYLENAGFKGSVKIRMKISSRAGTIVLLPLFFRKKDEAHSKRKFPFQVNTSNIFLVF